jgi:hypothetical protein
MKKLEEIFPLCPYADRCVNSDYGSEMTCIQDYESCDLYNDFERYEYQKLLTNIGEILKDLKEKAGENEE